MEKTSHDVKDIYDKSYFEKNVDGADDFGEFDGSWSSLHDRYQRNITLLGLGNKGRLLEVGCGRGEICLYHANNGGDAVGIDFSPAAIQMAKKKARDLNINVDLINDSFERMQSYPDQFDFILASEFIEHVSKGEGNSFFELAKSSLKKGGVLLVHTYPNTLQRKYGYPISRFISFFKSDALPKVQRDQLSDHYHDYHLNEQNYITLKRMAFQAGFTNVSIYYDEGPIHRDGVLGFLTGLLKDSFFRHLFKRDLVCICIK